MLLCIGFWWGWWGYPIPFVLDLTECWLEQAYGGNFVLGLLMGMNEEVTSPPRPDLH